MDIKNTIGFSCYDKHKKYESHYKPDEIFFGFGIESEYYLEFENEIEFDRVKFIQNHKKERYSVDYYSNYKLPIDPFFEKVKYNNKLPLLFNAHSMTLTDRYNQPRTKYTTRNEKNPLFDGETLWDFCKKNNEYLSKNFDKNFTFDGDTIEIMTVNFYNKSIKDVLEEHATSRKNLIDNLNKVFIENNIFQEYGRIDFMKKNHPFAVHLTNINNVAMFNNGTIHINITLPTKLDNNSKIQNKLDFIEKHKNFIRLIQYLEPIILSIYGTRDPFSEYDCRFSSSSQRCAISRYIGIGTYDTNHMKTGKILQESVDNIVVAKEEWGWYNRYYQTCGYNQLDKLGMDINFNKHYNHGVEIRFFDFIPHEKYEELCKFIQWLTFISSKKNFDNPIYSRDWNDMVICSLIEGLRWELNKTHKRIYEDIFGPINSTNVGDIYCELYSKIDSKEPEEFDEIVIQGIEKLKQNNSGSGCCSIL
jgi:hypothetical protein